ncbi:hypothetical protein EBR25_12470 [bacterium]|nr:hypothetical protein [bacterium]
MKHIITSLFAVVGIAASAQTFTMIQSEIVVVQINAEWNDINTRVDLERLRGCEYRFGWLEEQPAKLQETITALPVVVIYRDGRPAYQYAADISFRLDVPFEDIQEQVYRLKY